MWEESLPILVRFREIAVNGLDLSSVVLLVPESMILLQCINPRWQRVLKVLIVMVPMSMAIAMVMVAYFLVFMLPPLLQFVAQNFEPGIWPLIAILVVAWVIMGKRLADTLERQELVADSIVRLLARHSFGVGVSLFLLSHVIATAVPSVG